MTVPDAATLAETLKALALAAEQESWWLWDEPMPEGTGAVLAFAHAATPAAVLALLAALEQAQAERDKAERWRDEYFAMYREQSAQRAEAAAERDAALAGIEQLEALVDDWIAAHGEFHAYDTRDRRRTLRLRRAEQALIDARPQGAAKSRAALAGGSGSGE